WPWPLITNGIRPARLRTHIHSSTARARATRRYTSGSAWVCRPRSAPRADEAVPLVRTAIRGPPSEVDRAAVDRHRRLAEDLREGRVGVRRSAELPGHRLELQGDR